MREYFRGRRVLVTGGSHGIGLGVSHALARWGAGVVVVARSRQGVDTAVADLPGDRHLAISLDVADPSAWTDAMETIDRGGPLHGLVTAAAVLGPIGPLASVAPEEFGRAIAINLFGTMLALHHALPRLRETNGRVVTFSGGGATSPMPRYDAYAASKAAVIRLTENVAAAYAGEVEVNSVAPGFVATSIHDATLAAGPELAGAEYHAFTRKQLREGGVPATEAAELVCFLISDQAAGISGRLLSVGWDPWREESFRDRLRTDRSLGTLRRIDGATYAKTNSI